MSFEHAEQNFVLEFLKVQLGLSAAEISLVDPRVADPGGGLELLRALYGGQFGIQVLKLVNYAYSLEDHAGVDDLCASAVQVCEQVSDACSHLKERVGEDDL